MKDKMGWIDDLNRAFDPNRNGVAAALDPARNGAQEAFKEAFSAQTWDPAQNGVTEAFAETFDPAKNGVTEALAETFDPSKNGLAESAADSFSAQRWDPSLNGVNEGMTVFGEFVVNTLGGGINQLTSLVGAGEVVPMVGTTRGLQAVVQDALGFGGVTPARFLDTINPFSPLLDYIGQQTNTNLSLGSLIFGEDEGVWLGNSPADNRRAADAAQLAAWAAEDAAILAENARLDAEAAAAGGGHAWNGAPQATVGIPAGAWPVIAGATVLLAIALTD